MEAAIGTQGYPISFQLDDSLAGQRLGDFEIVRVVGKGGMGIVYEAVQTSLKRRVALKVLGTSLGLTPNAVERFQREALAAAKLHHTNIVPVYATGEERGIHFYAMELIDGIGLDAVIRQMREPAKSAAAPACPAELVTTAAYTPADPLMEYARADSSAGSSANQFDRIAAMMADVADALHHAHSNGVTHRDIKPSNLLLSTDGRLSITDFGLARMLEQPGMTMTGEFMGTPAYMSPEQITAGRIPIDSRTDIYSLGATLYELLTLGRPFEADGRDRLLAMIIQKEPAQPRSVNPSVPRDLETICLKCLEKDPDRRYANAKELADDLRRYVNRFAILAKRSGVIGRAQKWVKRNPVLASVAAALVLALGLAGAFALRAHNAEQRRLADAKQQDEKLQAQKREAALEKALVLALGGDFGGAEQLIGEAERLEAPAGDVRMMRGQIAYYQGDLATAIDHLEQAVRLQPGRAAPLALLASACSDFGLYDRYYELVLELSKLEIVSFEDYLFSGLADSFEKPERGLARIDEALRRRDSSVARALRARARSMAAMGTGNPAEAELAVEDARIAVAMLPGNPFALAQSVMSNLIAAGCYQRLGRTEEHKSAMSRAGKDVRALEPLRHVPVAGLARMIYFREMRDHNAIMTEISNRRKSGVTLTEFDESCLAMELYEQGESQRAIEVIDQSIARGGNTYLKRILRCFVLAELPDGPARARAALPELERSNVFALYVPAVLQLLGRRAEAVAAYRSLGRLFLDSNSRSEWVIHLVEFGAGAMPAEKLLTHAGSSPTALCEANFLIGISRLADGDRAGARVFFQNAVNTGVVWYVDYTFSRGFLSRLDANPNWPPWLPKGQ